MTMGTNTAPEDRGPSEGEAPLASPYGAVTGKGPWERLREAARNALNQRMSMETSDLAHRISRIPEQQDATQ